MTDEKKPGSVGPFRAEDFAGAVIFGCDSADHCADAANAKLAELWVALDEFETRRNWFHSEAPLHATRSELAAAQAAREAAVFNLLAIYADLREGEKT